MQTSSSTLLCFIASLLPSNLRESLAYSMGFHSAKHLRLPPAHTSQHNLYDAFLLEDNQVRERNGIKTHRGLARIMSPHLTQHCCLPPVQCRRGRWLQHLQGLAEGKKWQYSPVALASQSPSEPPSCWGSQGRSEGVLLTAAGFLHA